MGKTTKTVITRSRSIGKNPFEGRSQSTRTEETSLLPEDEARRLPLDEIIMVVDAQMPVRAKRIQYFDDRLFAAIHGGQKGELPFPELGRDGGKAHGPDFCGSKRGSSQAGTSAEPHAHDERLIGSKEIKSGISVPPTKKSSKAVQAVVEEEQRQMEMSFADQVEMQIEEIDGGDRDRLDTVVDDLDGLESQLKQGEGVSG